MSAPESRRERLRRELRSEVISVAHAQLREGGPSAVSWRGIARSVGMNPASLYTYFENLDDVFTAVILDSFHRLAEAMKQAATNASDRPASERLVAGALAYRAWAKQNPAEFNLIFTDQIAGYEAPPDGPTVAVQAEIFGGLAEALGELISDNLGEPAAGETLELPDDPSPVIGLWGTMHGLVMLEINHHLPFIDHHDQVYTAALQRALAGLNLD